MLLLGVLMHRGFSLDQFMNQCYGNSQAFISYIIFSLQCDNRVKYITIFFQLNCIGRYSLREKLFSKLKGNTKDR